MWLTLAGITVAFVVSVITADRSEKKEMRIFMVIALFVGFGIAIGSTIQQDAARKEEARGKQEAERKATEALEKLGTAKRQLEDLRVTLTLIHATVGDLGKLNEIGGGAKYYVRIAADTKQRNLLPYKQSLESLFLGARQHGLVAIRAPKKGSSNYELVFGQGLDLIAAEVFYRLATLHKYAPKDQMPELHREPSPPTS
jgi:hypothetical protein